jgi:hypothetical protein
MLVSHSAGEPVLLHEALAGLRSRAEPRRVEEDARLVASAGGTRREERVELAHRLGDERLGDGRVELADLERRAVAQCQPTDVLETQLQHRLAGLGRRRDVALPFGLRRRLALGERVGHRCVLGERGSGETDEKRENRSAHGDLRGGCRTAIRRRTDRRPLSLGRASVGRPEVLGEERRPLVPRRRSISRSDVRARAPARRTRR